MSAAATFYYDRERAEREQVDLSTDHRAIVSAAVLANGGTWPAQLTSGVMFYMGERITRAEFMEAAAE